MPTEGCGVSTVCGKKFSDEQFWMMSNHIMVYLFFILITGATVCWWLGEWFVCLVWRIERCGYLVTLNLSKSLHLIHWTRFVKQILCHLISFVVFRGASVTSHKTSSQCSVFTIQISDRPAHNMRCLLKFGPVAWSQLGSGACKGLVIRVAVAGCVTRAGEIQRTNLWSGRGTNRQYINIHPSVKCEVSRSSSSAVPSGSLSLKSELVQATCKPARKRLQEANCTAESLYSVQQPLDPFGPCSMFLQQDKIYTNPCSIEWIRHEWRAIDVPVPGRRPSAPAVCLTSETPVISSVFPAIANGNRDMRTALLEIWFWKCPVGYFGWGPATARARETESGRRIDGKNNCRAVSVRPCRSV